MKEGDRVFYRYIGSNPLSNDLSLHEAEVLSVGRIYFEIKVGGVNLKFKVKGMKYHSGNEYEYIAYLSEADFYKEGLLKNNRKAIEAALIGVTYKQSVEILKCIQSFKD